ncbi:hypothetical protein [Actinokineospora sp.]|uniref:hypothetical protein n=1 Tax=Actinokineospora sp. TaxID=1872133 RepID=UPI004037AB29
MNALIDLTTLFYSRPSLGASTETVAAWYLAKARLHERLAAEGGADSEQELAYAAESYRHARRLVSGE